MTSSSDAIFNPMIDLEASLGRIEYDNSNAINNNDNRKENPHHLTHIRNESSSSSSCDHHQRHQQQQQYQLSLSCCSSPSSNRQTRTSSRTPFLPADADAAAAANTDSNTSNSNSNLLKPYPISETNYEIVERRRLSESGNMMGQFVSTTASFDLNNSNNNNNNNDEQDQRSMMEVTVMEEYADDINVPHNEDFVLSAEEAGSMIDESLDTRTIQDDPGSFWENTPVITRTNTNQGHQSQSQCLSIAPMMQTSTSSDNLLMNASVPFSVSFSSSNHHHHPHDDSFVGEEDETADASPIRSSDMEW
jgi:hypothetical protein